VKKKQIRIEEVSNYYKKQIMRRKKFQRAYGENKINKVVKENDELEIELTGKQVKELDTIFKRFGSDLDFVLDSNLNEKQQPEYTKMSSKELEELGVVIKIDESIMDGIEELLDLGKESKDWYREMNQKILGAFGDSDGTLFLMLLAIFSPSMTLEQNLKAAARTFHGIKKDLSNPETKEKLEQVMEMKPSQVHTTSFPELMTLKAFENIRNPGSIKPNLLNILKLYKSSDYKLTPKQAATEISKHMKPTGLVDKSTIVSAEKLFSFTLNLLDPDFQFESGWIPVTMDIWMSNFFYPQMNTEERRKALAAKGGKNYVYLAKLTQELAPRYGMTPTQFQAAIWVGKIKKDKGDKYVSTFLQAIESNLKRLNVKIEELKNMDNFLSKVIEVIGTATYSKPIKKEPKKKTES
jgi:hypothetical protein